MRNGAGSVPISNEATVDELELIEGKGDAYELSCVEATEPK